MITEREGNVWACNICFFSNKASSDNCELCGVRKQADADTSPSIQHNTTTDSSACIVCTFMNHPSMVQCEMCGADLPKEIIPTPTTSTASVESSTPHQAQIRLSFRQGGQSSFLSKLKLAVAEKRWEQKVESPTSEPSTPKKRGVGISKL